MSELRQLVGEELDLPADARVTSIAGRIAAKHGPASRAVLFYGSCLRQRQLDGLMLDFYLIVSDYRAAYAKRWLALANHLIPPNVFYFEHDGLAAKYAVLSEEDFAHECGDDAWTVSTAARFAQPARLVWSADQAAAERTADIVALAAPTVLGWTLPMIDSARPIDLWKRAFELTFAAELRAEPSDRSASIVDSDPPRYQRFGLAALQDIAAKRAATGGEVPLARSAAAARHWWRRKQNHGKRYSIARLAKGTVTFEDWPDYIIWKVNRHAGTDIALRPWQRRWPRVAAISLLPRLLRSGAVR